MAVIQQFRTAVRGFNRQDVQDYIEQMAAVHRQELAELQKRLEKSDRRIQELEETVSGIDALADESSRTRAALWRRTGPVRVWPGSSSSSSRPP